MEYNLDEIKSELTYFAKKNKGNKIGILYGAFSYEDKKYIETAPYNLASGAALSKALTELGFSPLYIDPTIDDLIARAKECSFVFNNLHGEFGEDGAVQSLLKYHGIKCTGAYILGHAIGINKAVCKLLIKGLGFQTPNFKVIYENEDAIEAVGQATHCLKKPWVLKPLFGGSSVGMKFIENEHDALSCVKDILNYDSGVLLEEYIEGIDMTVGILEFQKKSITMPPLKTINKSKLYDENIKLHSHWAGSVSYECPAKIEDSLTEALQDYSTQIFKTIRCSGFARIDWRIDKFSTPYFLEINTNPGISEGGNFALGAYALGLNYHELILAMLKSCDE